MLVRGIVVAILTIGSTVYAGYVSGTLTHRWGTDKELIELGAKLDAFPETFEGWKLAQERPMLERHKEMLMCVGDFVRDYRHDSGALITASVLLGPTGPMSVHDPDVCYEASGYQVLEEPAKEEFSIGDKTVTLWTTTMVHKQNASQIKVLWAWYDGEEWRTPELARFAFVGKKYLYKLQIVAPINPARGVELSGLDEFLTDFFPELDQYLAKDANS